MGVTKRVRYTIEGPKDALTNYTAGHMFTGDNREVVRLEWISGHGVKVNAEEVRTAGVVGPFDPDADYPRKSLAVEPSSGITARFNGATWHLLFTEFRTDNPMVACLENWKRPQVVFIP